MEIVLSHRCAVSSSRRIKIGRTWVRKSNPRKIVRRTPKRLPNRKQLNKRVMNRKIKEGIARLKSEMAEISADQKSIAEGQKQVRERYEEIKKEREQLWKETQLIAEQSSGIRARLNLMFQLLKARVESDSTKVAQLTRSLRDLIAKPTEQNQVLTYPDGK